ncbi:MAG: MSMEG_4193 family putative phosphomutase [Actinomyces sp.]|nr:MAG: MSMEG_4193 family putative phosphomutase [Actinomyces sp.]
MAPTRSSRSAGPRPTLVLWVRHGRTPTTGAVLPGRAPGLHLAEEGRRQAEDAARRIAALGTVRAVYASPMERTRETAAPIARACGLRVRRHRGLIECDFGEWTGRRLANLRRRREWRTVQRHPSSFRFPGGESFAEMQARGLAAVTDLVARHPGEAIVAVSHADVIKAVMASALGTPLDLFQRIVIGPCSISAVVYGPEGPTVLAVNSTGDDLRSLVPS